METMHVLQENIISFDFLLIYNYFSSEYNIQMIYEIN